MEVLEGVIATTRLDRHNEKISIEALEKLVSQINTNYLPVGIEHDPRIPPQGRIKSAVIRTASDGEQEVFCTMEIFGKDNVPIEINNDREIRIYEYPFNDLIVGFDRNFKDPSDQVTINELSAILKSKPIESIKKSFDPLSILTIGGGFLLGGIAVGILNKIGSDTWDLAKSKIKDLMKKSKDGEREKLLSFCFTIKHDEYIFDVEVILTNPSSEDIEDFLERGFDLLDKVLPFYLDKNRLLKKLVFEYQDKKLNIKFGVRKDCVPLFPSVSVDQIVESLSSDSNP